MRKIKNPKTPPFSKMHLLLFALLFGLIGSFLIFRSFAANPNLPGDVNSDNRVDSTDLNLLLSHFNTTDTIVDLNTDAKTNILDLSILLSHYGQTYTPPGSSTYSNFLGLDMYLTGDFANAKSNTGISRVRMDKPGSSQYSAAKTAGMTVLPILAYNPWSDLNGGQGDKWPPTSQNYATWASRMLADLKNTITSTGSPVPEAIEVWNEPWIQAFWQPKPDPVAYYNLFKITAQQAWAIWPNVKVLISADTNGDTNVNGDLTWRARILAADTSGFLNDPRVLPTTHNYVQSRTPTTVTSQPCAWDYERYKCAYNDFKAHGHPNPQIWVTEMGWVAPSGADSVSLAQQKDYMVQAFQIAKNSGMVAKVYSFLYKSGDSWGYNWLDTSNNCKPVCAAVKTLIGP